MSLISKLKTFGSIVREELHAFAHPANEVTIGDFQHIQGTRFTFRNPHVDRQTILTFLATSPEVHAACKNYDLRGEYALRAVIIDGELRVNVYEVNPASGQPGECQAFEADWVNADILQYTLDIYEQGRFLTKERKGAIRALEGPVFGGFIDPFAPVWSWKLELDLDTQRKLGLKVLG